jgi:hypothetical protein
LVVGSLKPGFGILAKISLLTFFASKENIIFNRCSRYQYKGKKKIFTDKNLINRRDTDLDPAPQLEKIPDPDP